MKLRLWQVDAFTGERFHGNPAAVVPLPRWLDDATLAAIASENNLSETAFLVRKGRGYELRWFTPSVEVSLCGHATLASAHVVFEHLEPKRRSISFETRSGTLKVVRRRDRLEMDFPATEARHVPAPPLLLAAMGQRPNDVLSAGWTWLLVYADEDTVRALKPDFTALSSVEPGSAIATARGEHVDFVSRFFGPSVGVDEDPVTGSAHCVLAPYWAQRLGRTTLEARQVSARGGEVSCVVRGERVQLGGRVVPYLTGRIDV